MDVFLDFADPELPHLPDTEAISEDYGTVKPLPLPTPAIDAAPVLHSRSQSVLQQTSDLPARLSSHTPQETRPTSLTTPATHSEPIQPTALPPHPSAQNKNIPEQAVPLPLTALISNISLTPPGPRSETASPVSTALDAQLKELAIASAPVSHDASEQQSPGINTPVIHDSPSGNIFDKFHNSYKTD